MPNLSSSALPFSVSIAKLMIVAEHALELRLLKKTYGAPHSQVVFDVVV